ncbi:hypothetical protein Glove_19g179 [Diversispora epigaea]|uniref:Uncharacterized protein n=1 Tax=Diversispora epigaea TaxID=1348612 RepID=A0A397JN98_9GLOM|nr:hypothetical protein Glove_19g179 [Diversispora epigaea]
MKLIGEKKIFSVINYGRDLLQLHSEDSQAQQPVLLAAAMSNPTPPSPPSPPKNLLRHLNITKFKIDCAKHFKKENQVVHYCTKYLIHFPNSYNTMYDRAEAYEKLKKYDEAINNLDAAILLRPQRSTAWCLRGVVKGLKKSYTDALDDLNKAIVIDPIDCLALKWRAFCYSNLKSYEQALSDLNIVINLGCSNEFTYINRANIYRELKNPGESYKDAASGSSIKLASITDMTPKIELSSFSNPEVDNNINANALSVINDMGDKSIINNTTSTQEEPSTSTKQVSIIGTTSKARLSGFDDSEVNNNINSLSNFNNSKEKNIINDNNSIQTINLASIDTTSKTVLLSLGNLEIDNINVSSNINNTEKKNDINNINPTSNETTSITGTTFKPLLSGVSEVDSKINALSNIINNFKSTQKEPSCGDERKNNKYVNKINEIFDEIFNCVEKMKKYREQQQKKRNNNEIKEKIIEGGDYDLSAGIFYNTNVKPSVGIFYNTNVSRAEFVHSKEENFIMPRTTFHLPKLLRQEECMCEKYAGHDKYDHADQSRSRFCGRTTFLPSIVHTLRDFITPFLFSKKGKYTRRICQWEFFTIRMLVGLNSSRLKEFSQLKPSVGIFYNTNVSRAEFVHSKEENFIMPRTTFHLPKLLRQEECMCEKYAGHDKYDHADQSRSRFCGRTTFLPSIVHTLRDFITPFLISRTLSVPASSECKKLKTLIIKWICLSSSPPQVTFDFPSSLINLANFNFIYSQQIIGFWKNDYVKSIGSILIFKKLEKLENLSIDVTCYSLFWTIKSLHLKLIYFTSLQELCIVYRLYNSDSLHLASSFAQSRSFHY